MMQLLHGLEESIYLYQQTIADLVAKGHLSDSEGNKRLSSYQARLTEICALVNRDQGKLGIDQGQRANLKNELKRIKWRLQLHSEEQNAQNETDAIVAYLNHKRQQAMRHLEKSMEIARALFHAVGPLREVKEKFIQIKAVEQLTKKTFSRQIPCWFWGKTPVHFDQRLVDDIQRQTGCKATIFQRIPDGFIRIATNIRQIDGQRAVGTFIPQESSVVKTVLQGKSYRGSAFVLNNWYLSIYEPFYLDGRIAGILYVGRREALELTPAHALSEEKVEHIFNQLKVKGAFPESENERYSGKLIQALSNLPDHETHPVINMGLKEVAAMLLKEQEKSESAGQRSATEPTLDAIVQYIHNNLTEDISIDLLAERSFMSKASFYRYFKTKLNTTPKAFINQERLRQAYQLMQKNTSMSVQDICEQVGFKSTSYFIKLFRQHYGVTPKQYQMQIDEISDSSFDTP